MICTFFGHRDAPQDIYNKLEAVLIDLIENEQVNIFYVGSQGSFDGMAKKALTNLKAIYPHIKYAVVLAYMPEKNSTLDYKDYSDTILPEGLERVPPKFAISKRNEWMLNKADFVVTYVKYSVGGAAKFKALAEKKGKNVINLAND